MTQEQIEEINNRVREVYGENFLAIYTLQVIVAKSYDLGHSDEEVSHWYKKGKVISE